MSEQLTKLAGLLNERNRVDHEIATLIGRPAERSHIGEYIARLIFDITEPNSASQADNDGTFASEALSGRTVNVKFYGKDDGIWDIKPYPAVDYYLVLTGVRSGASSSRGTTRPLIVKQIFLMPENVLKDHAIKPGIAASVRQSLRDPYRIYPTVGRHAVVSMTDEQRKMVGLFDQEIGA